MFARFVVMGPRAILLGLCVCACGCVESQLEPAHSVAFTPPGDTFWLQEAREMATRPPPQRAQSISLGYIGDAPLAGGVMRDTPMPQAYDPSYMQNAPIQQRPCRCDIRDARYEFEEPQ